MTRVVFRSEVIEEHELELVPRAKLVETVRRLERTPEVGKPLRRELAGYQSIHIAGVENRLVYKHHLDGDLVEVIAIERRRENEVYDTAVRRVQN
jgi:mRNA-degrading endonuclease RelE of RelBE toxin-antitoxin system